MYKIILDEMDPRARKLLAAQFHVDSPIHEALQKPDVHLENAQDARDLERIANRICPQTAAMIRREVFAHELWAHRYEPHYAHLSRQV